MSSSLISAAPHALPETPHANNHNGKLSTRGRPSALTPEVQTQILRLAALGAPNRVIYQAVGVSRSTFFQWLRLGDADFKPRDGEHVPADRTPYLDFVDSYRRSRALPIILCERVWLAAVEAGDWRAAERWLRLHHPGIHDDDNDYEENAPFGDLQGAMDEWAASIRRMVDNNGRL